VIPVATKIKVLLTQDVDKLGRAGEVKDVSGGYGRNYLIPKGLAVVATRGQVKQAEERLAAQRKRDEAGRRDAEALAARVNGQTLRFTARVGELDRLYGSITNADIGERIGQLLNDPSFDRRKVELEDPIKRIGIYPVNVRFMSGVNALVNVVVEGEEGSIQLPPDPDAEDAE
jgi:large subunit ribosomal protein L9